MLRNCFQIAVGHWGLSVDSFERMSLEQWYWLYDVKRQDAQQASILADDELWELIGERAPYGRARA